jgi:hypothetical protein
VPDRQRRRGNTSGWIAVAGIGAGLLILGSFLAWVTLIAAFVGSVSVSGTDGGDGWISVCLGIAASLVVALAWNQKASLTLECLPGGAGLVLMIYEAIHISNKVATVNSSKYARAGIGAGIWVCLAGAIILCVCGVQGFRRGSVGPAQLPAR